MKNNICVFTGSRSEFGIYKILIDKLNKSKIKRPLISHLIEETEIKEFIGKHLFERNFFYEKSEKKINTDGKTVREVANEIIKKLG